MRHYVEHLTCEIGAAAFGVEVDQVVGEDEREGEGDGEEATVEGPAQKEEAAAGADEQRACVVFVMCDHWSFYEVELASRI